MCRMGEAKRIPSAIDTMDCSLQPPPILQLGYNWRRTGNGSQAHLFMIQAGRKILALIVLLFSVSSMADVAIPPLVSRVTDLTGTLSANETAQLERKLREAETRKGS